MIILNINNKNNKNINAYDYNNNYNHHKIIIIIQVWTLGRPIFYSLLPLFPSQITPGPSWTLDWNPSRACTRI